MVGLLKGTVDGEARKAYRNRETDHSFKTSRRRESDLAADLYAGEFGDKLIIHHLMAESNARTTSGRSLTEL